MTQKISKSTLGLAAEYSVAGELCRRNLYAQLTLGNQKRTDILVFSEDEELTRIEVKAKQGREWPNCRGIYGANIFIVFVDFHLKDPTSRPDFYILSVADWRRVLRKRIAEIQERNPEKVITIDPENVAVFEEEINRHGKAYRGMGIRASDLVRYQERWDKILKAVKAA